MTASRRFADGICTVVRQRHVEKTELAEEEKQ